MAAIGHIGSWGTPELGLTELLGSLFGAQRTAQGGSDILPNVPATPTPTFNSGGALNLNQALRSGGLTLNTPLKGVLGDNTQNRRTSSGIPGSQPPSNTQNPDLQALQAEYERQREAARSEIEGGFGEYERRLGELEGLYGQQQQSALGSAEQTYANILKGLEEQKGSGLAKLETGRQQVKARGAQSLEDLKRNLEDVVKSMSFRLGALGAGDTSATQVMLPYAYTKLAGVQGGAIQRQVNDQLFEIDKQQKDLETQFSQLWTQMQSEKANLLEQIRNEYGQKLAYIQSLRAQLPRERAEALSTLARELKNEALGRLVTLENWSREREATLQDWARSRMASLETMKQQLSQTANFTPQDILYQRLQQTDLNQPAGQEVYTPSQLLALAKRRREELAA